MQVVHTDINTEYAILYKSHKLVVKTKDKKTRIKTSHYHSVRNLSHCSFKERVDIEENSIKGSTLNFVVKGY